MCGSLALAPFPEHGPTAWLGQFNLHSMDGCKKRRLGQCDFFPDLSTAACELRAATTTSKLESCAGEGWKDVEAFYERLNSLQKTYDINSKWYQPIIVSVEGVENSGGKSFVQDLGDMWPHSSVRVAFSPPASLSTVKAIFEQVGGAAARAFDVVSSYMVVQECKDVCVAERLPLVFLIDNFCSSVSRWVWPPGLLKPRLQLSLDESRSLEVPGARMERIGGEDVLRAAKRAVDLAIFPSTEDLESELGADPLRRLVQVARREGFLRDAAGDKKWQLGRRGKHVPWSFQLATPNRQLGGTPAVRNLGIHSVTETGFIFFSLGSAGGATGQPGEEVFASMVLLLGSYPFQQQWRGEGIVRRGIFGFRPLIQWECEPGV